MSWCHYDTMTVMSGWMSSVTPVTPARVVVRCSGGWWCRVGRAHWAPPATAGQWTHPPPRPPLVRIALPPSHQAGAGAGGGRGVILFYKIWAEMSRVKLAPHVCRGRAQTRDKSPDKEDFPLNPCVFLIWIFRFRNNLGCFIMSSYKPKMFRSQDGCCICRAKSSRWEMFDKIKWVIMMTCANTFLFAARGLLTVTSTRPASRDASRSAMVSSGTGTSATRVSSSSRGGRSCQSTLPKIGLMSSMPGAKKWN